MIVNNNYLKCLKIVIFITKEIRRNEGWRYQAGTQGLHLLTHQSTVDIALISHVWPGLW